MLSPGENTDPKTHIFTFSFPNESFYNSIDNDIQQRPVSNVVFEICSSISLLIGIVIVMNQLIADTISQFNMQEKKCAKACILYTAFIIYTH